MTTEKRVPKWLERQRVGSLRRMEAELQQRLREVRREIETAVARHERFAEVRQELCFEADRTDHMIMLWAQRNPRVCASNAPTGECISYGGRRQI